MRFKNKIVRSWDALKIGFNLEKEVWWLPIHGTVSNKARKGPWGERAGAEHTSRTVLNPCSPPSPRCDFNQNKTKYKPKWSRQSICPVAVLWLSRPPWGSSFPPPSLLFLPCSRRPPKCLLSFQQWFSMWGRGSDSAWEGTFGNTWRHFCRHNWGGSAAVI